MTPNIEEMRRVAILLESVSELDLTEEILSDAVRLLREAADYLDPNPSIVAVSDSNA